MSRREYAPFVSVFPPGVPMYAVYDLKDGGPNVRIPIIAIAVRADGEIEYWDFDEDGGNANALETGNFLRLEVWQKTDECPPHSIAYRVGVDQG